MFKRCELCAKRADCRKTCGMIFGYCESDFAPVAKLSRTFHLGKIAYTNKRARVNAVKVEVSLTKCGGGSFFTIDPKTKDCVRVTPPEYWEFSACGFIYNARGTDYVRGGQCLDEIAAYSDQLQDPDLFAEIYDFWKFYHLNGMHAGTLEQDAAIDEWGGNSANFDAVCAMLKEKGLYEVPFYGKSGERIWHGELYQHGSAWLVREIPDADLTQIAKLLQ